MSFISVLAEEYHTDKEQYMRKARELTQQKASQITWEEYKTVTRIIFYSSIIFVRHSVRKQQKSQKSLNVH